MTNQELAERIAARITPEFVASYFDALERELYVSRANRVRYEALARELFFGRQDGRPDDHPAPPADDAAE